MKRYGIQGRDGQWLRWATIDAAADDGELAVGWTPLHQEAWSRTEREAKALSQLVPSGNHPLRVRTPTEGL